MNIYDFGHSPLNPIGKFEPICESQGHGWRTIWLMDRQYRICNRCERHERRTDSKKWEVNVIKPSVVE